MRTLVLSRLRPPVGQTYYVRPRRVGTARGDAGLWVFTRLYARGIPSSTTTVKHTPLMLPCRNCEKHMQQHVQENDTRAACQSNDSLRERGGEAPWTSEQARKRYGTAELCID